MKIGEVDDDNIKKWLKVTDFENFFDIYEDAKGYFYNLNETVYLNIDNSIIEEYTCDHIMQWPLVSYKIYGTTRLAWLLMKLNNIDISNVFTNLVAGQKVKYLPQEQMQNVIEQIIEYNED